MRVAASPRPTPYRLRALGAVTAAVTALALFSPPVGAATLGAPTTPAVDEAEASHRSVPLELSAAAPQRTLPGTESADGRASDATAGPSRTATLTLEEGVHVIGVRWEGPEADGAELRVREPGGSWGEWTALEDAVPTTDSAVGTVAGESDGVDVLGGLEAPVDEHDHTTRATTGDVVVGASEVQVRLAGEATDASLEVWTTQATADDATAVANLPITTNNLVIGTRADWGADETAPRVSDPIDLVHNFPKLGVTIHHTAGINGYGAAQVPSIIRGIFYYHGQTLKWDDIGYAAVVDRFGRVWEGRAGGVEENIQLAHAFGMNRDWTGVAVLGNHETSGVVWASELTALAELTAWNLDTHGVTPGTTVRYANPSEGWTRTLPVVHGHRDVALTLCPGGELYALMGLLRDWVARDYAEGSDAVQRHGGSNRYAAAAGMAERAFLEGTGTAYLASGEDLPDALGVGPIAHARGAAVLLTKAGSVPAETLSALTTLGVRNVVVVGGENVVSQAVVDTLLARGLSVSRVSGENRFATAVALAEQAPGPVQTVYLGDGQGLVDALGGAAAAAAQRGAVLLTRPTTLPPVTADALVAMNPSRVVVLGGPTAVSESVMGQVAGLVPGASVERIGGSNRFATSALLATDSFDTASSAVVASGAAPIDALAGTQLAARHDSPVVLTRKNCRPASVDAAYDELGISLSRLAGGPNVLSWSAGHTVCR